MSKFTPMHTSLPSDCPACAKSCNSLHEYPVFLPRIIPLYNVLGVQALEQSWFDQHDAYGLMQQAAWQACQWILTHHPLHPADINPSWVIGLSVNTASAINHIIIWVGAGNNGGDGWLLGSYLREYGYRVQMVEVAKPATELSIRAKAQACASRQYQRSQWQIIPFDQGAPIDVTKHTLLIDAVFGIGLTRQVTGVYAKAIAQINSCRHFVRQVLALDIPSGLHANTGRVMGCAVKAEVTLCLLARKVGLHLADAKEVAGYVVDLPLIPLLPANPLRKLQSLSKTSAAASLSTAGRIEAGQPIAWLYQAPLPWASRRQNTHKGSHGHVLIIGGRCDALGQGMGGAAILAAHSAFAMGVGKVTVACDASYHGALLAQLPNAMVLDIHHAAALTQAIQQVDAVAVGMGLGRDAVALDCLTTLMQALHEHPKPLVMDADALYHLATDATLAQSVKEYAQGYPSTAQNLVWFTPHDGEAARLLEGTVADVTAERLSAVQQLAGRYGGGWLLKGSSTIILEPDVGLASSTVEDRITTDTASDTGAEDLRIHDNLATSGGWHCAISPLGNAGMATAGMGDVLAGMAVATLVMHDQPIGCRSLRQVALVHGRAGDELMQDHGMMGLHAGMMAQAITKVNQQLSCALP